MNSKSIVVRLTGGVGNQLFQYSCGRSIAIRNHCDLYLDSSSYALSAEKALGRTFDLDRFKIRSTKNDLVVKTLLKPYSTRFVNRLNLALPWKRIKEPQFHFDAGILRLTPPLYLDGHWQSYKYFSDIESTLRYDLAFTELPPEFSSEASTFTGDDSVMLHIRRGDYVSDSRVAQIHGALSLDYYYRALEQLSSLTSTKLRLFVFSDDYDWVRQNFTPAGYKPELACDLTPGPAHDLYFMSLCRHHIIANSSFSWWSAWLSERRGITMAPRTWFHDASRDTSDLVPPDWRLI